MAWRERMDVCNLPPTIVVEDTDATYENTTVDCSELSNEKSTPLGLGDVKINIKTLIEEVRKRSTIWDRRSPTHSNPVTMRAAWMSISEKMGIPPHLLRRKWKNIRGHFAVEIAKPYYSSWAHFDSLMFLNGFVKPRGKYAQVQDQPKEPKEERDPLAFSPEEEIKEDNDSSSNEEKFDPWKVKVVNIVTAAVTPVQSVQPLVTQPATIVTSQDFYPTNAPLPQMNTQAFDPSQFVAVASTSLSEQSVSTQMIDSNNLGMDNVQTIPDSSTKVFNANSQITPPVPPMLANGTEQKPCAVASPTPHLQPLTAEIIDSEDRNLRTDPIPKKKPRLDTDNLVPESKSSNETNNFTRKESVDLTAEADPTENENDENFFRSLLPHVRKIPMHLKLRFRNRVNQLVEEFAYPEVRQ